MVTHEFGGDWTNEKLTCLRKYLIAYRSIFTANKMARYYTTYYVDAFAGTGTRNLPAQKADKNSYQLFGEIEETDDVNNFLDGSVKTALEIPSPFDKYLFIDNNPTYIESLNEIISGYRNLEKSIDIVLDDANDFLKKWCNNINWKKHRAVVFLDPYGMQVDWKLIEILAGTKAVDLWLLFPLGMAVNRCLTKGSLPPKPWADALTKTFGTDEWKSFYKQHTQRTLFGEEELTEKTASFDDIEEFFVTRLEMVFKEVVKKPLKLMNSRNNPLFILCFASENKNGAKIARDIICRMNG